MPVMRKKLNAALLERHKAKLNQRMHTDLMVEEFRKGLIKSNFGGNIKSINASISRHAQEAMDAAVKHNRANEAVEEEMFARKSPGAMKWRRAAIRLNVARRAAKTGLASLKRDSARLNSLGKRRLKKI